MPLFLNTDKTTDLFIVMLHEFGHSIGLGHSKDWHSVMGEEYKGYDPNKELAMDDIVGVQYLYGKLRSTTHILTQD